MDIVCGGSPCQDLSIAGLRAGLAGARSGLFMEQLRVIREELGEENPLDAYILCLDPSAKLKALQITTELRSNGYRCEMDYLGRSFKAQFKTVDRRAPASPS